jgi:hypothetical protein
VLRRLAAILIEGEGVDDANATEDGSGGGGGGGGTPAASSSRRPLAPIADVPGVRLALGALGRRWTAGRTASGGGGGAPPSSTHDGEGNGGSAVPLVSPAAAAAAAKVDGDALCDAVAVLAAEARDRGARWGAAQAEFSCDP